MTLPHINIIKISVQAVLGISGAYDYEEQNLFQVSTEVTESLLQWYIEILREIFIARRFLNTAVSKFILSSDRSLASLGSAVENVLHLLDFSLCELGKSAEKSDTFNNLCQFWSSTQLHRSVVWYLLRCCCPTKLLESAFDEGQITIEDLELKVFCQESKVKNGNRLLLKMIMELHGIDPNRPHIVSWDIIPGTTWNLVRRYMCLVHSSSKHSTQTVSSTSKSFVCSLQHLIDEVHATDLNYLLNIYFLKKISKPLMDDISKKLFYCAPLYSECGVPVDSGIPAVDGAYPYLSISLTDLFSASADN